MGIRSWELEGVSEAYVPDYVSELPSTKVVEVGIISVKIGLIVFDGCT